jgi:hypothetical protein
MVIEVKIFVNFLMVVIVIKMTQNIGCASTSQSPRRLLRYSISSLLPIFAVNQSNVVDSVRITANTDGRTTIRTAGNRNVGPLVGPLVVLLVRKGYNYNLPPWGIKNHVWL